MSDTSGSESTAEDNTYKLRSRKRKGAAKKKNPEPMQRKKMKKELYEKIREKMKNVGPDSEDSDSQEEASDKKTKADKKRLLGNRNASRSIRRISISWTHNLKAVRTRTGGGTRVIAVSNDALPTDLLPIIKGYFFPSGTSAKGLQETDCTFELRDFAHNPLDPKETVGRLCERIQPGGKLRYHLYSNGPEIKSTIIVETAAGEDAEVHVATQSIRSSESAASTSGAQAHIAPTSQVLKCYNFQGAYMEDGNQIILIDATPTTEPAITSNPLIDSTYLEEGPSTSSSHPSAGRGTANPNVTVNITDHSLATGVINPAPVFVTETELGQNISTDTFHSSDGVNKDQIGSLISGSSVMPRTSREALDTEHCRDGQFLSDSSSLSDLPTPRSPTPPPNDDDITVLRIHRVNVQVDMIEAFKDPAILDKVVTFQFVDERGVDAKGLSREAYTMFWKSFMERSTKGEAERVPSVQPHYQKPEWQAVGRILLKGFRDVQVFPLQLSKAFVIVLLFGEEAVSPDNLIESFMSYITPPEKNAVTKALKGDLDDDSDAKEELFDMLSRMESETVPSSPEAVRICVMNLAQTELVQVGKYPLDAIISTARAGLLQLLPDVRSVHDLYTSKAPTVRKVINLFQPQSEGKDEVRATTYLKQYIKGLDQENLKRFLRHVTGCEMICVTFIEIHFNKRKGIDRAPVVRTCTPMIELPTTYSSYTELRVEFNNILSREVPIDID